MGAPSFLLEASDAELAALTATGDRSAFDILVRRHSGLVRALLRRMGAQPSLADDIAQDAFVAAFQSIGGYRATGSFAAWIKQIAARLYVRRWRAEARYTDLEGAEETADESSSDGRLDLDAALAILSNAERLCVSMCSGAGFSHSEAGALLKMPAGTVKSHVKRGLDKLRRRLEASQTQVRSRADG
ncbi:MAG TPA: RNA polymerase sigma factor [Caulobacteraceae bacterium]|nr:RNA polymerase sigma factor [Caulobacteraceae bacterium]